MASILVAENDDAFLRLLDCVLTAAGHEVIMANNAIEATKIVEQISNPIDLLCTDAGGAVLAKVLRTRYPKMKVLIIITENPRYVVVDAPAVCNCDPAFTVLRKPFTLPQLVAKIEEIVNTGAGASSPTTPGALA